MTKATLNMINAPGYSVCVTGERSQLLKIAHVAKNKKALVLVGRELWITGLGADGDKAYAIVDVIEQKFGVTAEVVY